MNKPAWFEREQPRDWNRGKITLEGDRIMMTWPARILVITITLVAAWGFVSLVFCISSK
jgi:hypothetical protein